MRSKDTLFRREIVWVQPNPRKIERRDMKDGVLNMQDTLLNSVATALIQTTPRGVEHVVLRHDGPYFDFQPAKEVVKFLGTDESAITRLSPEDFDEFAKAYSGGTNNYNALRQIVASVEKHAPAFRFIPTHLHYLVNGKDDFSNPYRNLPRMFLRHDLTEYEALVWVNRAVGQISPKKFLEWNVDPKQLLHTGEAWYAFPKLEDAVSLKVMTQTTEIHRIRTDI